MMRIKTNSHDNREKDHLLDLAQVTLHYRHHLHHPIHELDRVVHLAMDHRLQKDDRCHCRHCHWRAN